MRGPVDPEMNFKQGLRGWLKCFMQSLVDLQTVLIETERKIFQLYLIKKED